MRIGYEPTQIDANRRNIKRLGHIELTFSEYVKCFKPILGRRRGSSHVRDLVSMITSVPDELIGTNGDPSVYLKDTTLKAYASGSRIISKPFANSVLMWLDKENFITSLGAFGDDTLNLIADNLSVYDDRVNKFNVAEEAAEIFEQIFRNASSGDITSNVDKEKHSQNRTDQLTREYGSRLAIETGGNCPNDNCTRRLHLENNGVTKANYSVTIIDSSGKLEYENLIALCPECSNRYSLSPSNPDVDRMRLIKRSLMENERAITRLSVLDLEEEIIRVLQKLREVDPGELIELEYEPKAVRDKIPAYEHILLNKTINYVSVYFQYVSDLLRSLDEQGKLHFNSLAMQIKMAYIKISHHQSSRTQTYEQLVDWLMSRTNQQRSPCEVIISYFIQSCEVFDAISQ